MDIPLCRDSCAMRARLNEFLQYKYPLDAATAKSRVAATAVAGIRHQAFREKANGLGAGTFTVSSTSRENVMPSRSARSRKRRMKSSESMHSSMAFGEIVGSCFAVANC